VSDLAEVIEDLRRRVSQLERRQRSQLRTGVVAEVDPGQGLARVRLLDSDPPFLTGWIPWSEPSAGANRTHNPPSVGQQVQITSESGDLHDAVIQGSLNSDANARPSGAGDAHVLASIGGVTITVSGAELAITGGQVTHNGKDIGDTHTHGGITPGPGDTNPPN